MRSFLQEYFNSHKDNQGKYSIEDNLDLWIEIIQSNNDSQVASIQDFGVTACLTLEILGRKGRIHEVQQYLSE